VTNNRELKKLKNNRELRNLTNNGELRNVTNNHELRIIKSKQELRIITHNMQGVKNPPTPPLYGAGRMSLYCSSLVV
jgi:hypothetical protein